MYTRCRSYILEHANLSWLTFKPHAILVILSLSLVKNKIFILSLCLLAIALYSWNLDRFQNLKTKESIANLQIQSERGDVNSQLELAKRYLNGDGVAKNSVESFNWAKKAADQGNPYALYTVGGFYHEGIAVPKNIDLAIEYNKKAADLGDPQAEAVMGSLYYSGEFLEKDDEQAFHWFSSAADQGLASAQNQLAKLYYKGHGVKQDLYKTFHWTEKAAEQGDATAQARLGYLYYNGKGVTENIILAYHYYDLAATNGNKSAQHFLDCFHEDMSTELIAKTKRLSRTCSNTIFSVRNVEDLVTWIGCKFF